MADTDGAQLSEGAARNHTERHCAAVIPEAAKVEGSVKERDGENPALI